MNKDDYLQKRTKRDNFHWLLATPRRRKLALFLHRLGVTGLEDKMRIITLVEEARGEKEEKP